MPGHLVLIDQYIDRTTKRPSTFYDASVADVRGVMHLPQGDPFSGVLRQLLLETCQEIGYAGRVHETGTMVSIEGPRSVLLAKYCLLICSVPPDFRRVLNLTCSELGAPISLT